MRHLELLDSFLIGHAQIDAEHAHLVALMNDCIDIANAGGSREDFCTALQTVENALIKHVNHEEAIMRHYGYGHMEGDIEIHEQGLALFRDLAHDCRHPVSMEEILRQASTFILTMILKSDLGFKSHLERIGYTEKQDA